eukprot:16306-Chlamydomonas_euryale.AAC.1
MRDFGLDSILVLDLDVHQVRSGKQYTHLCGDVLYAEGRPLLPLACLPCGRVDVWTACMLHMSEP